MDKNTDLQQRLGQYRVTAEAQIAQGRPISEVACYAAAVGAGLAMAGVADASIVYSGVLDISVMAPTAGGTMTAPVTVGGSSFELIAARGNGIGIGFLEGVHGAGLLQQPKGPPIFPAANVPGSHFVGGTGGTFRSGKYGAGLIASANHGYGNFPLGVTGAAGFMLGNGDFGWIHLRIDSTDHSGIPNEATVIDWAFDDTGAPIHVPTSVPEPSSLALLALGAAGLAAFRRRKAAPPN